MKTRLASAALLLAALGSCDFSKSVHKDLLTGQDGSVIIDSDDAYDQFSGGFTHDPLLLSANLDLGAPMRSDTEYHLEIRIWDKQ